MHRHPADSCTFRLCRTRRKWRLLVALNLQYGEVQEIDNHENTATIHLTLDLDEAKMTNLRRCVASHHFE